MLTALLRRLTCRVVGHDYTISRRINRNTRQLKCPRCRGLWAMHDPTRSVVPWTQEIEEMYAPGGPLDPAVFKG